MSTGNQCKIIRDSLHSFFMWNLQKSSVYFALRAQLHPDADFSSEMLDLRLEMIIKIAIKNVDSKHYY